MTKHKFFADFGRGLTCEATVDLSAIAPGQAPVIDFMWSGQPTRAVLKKYVRWKRAILQDIANLTGQSILDAILLGGGRIVFCHVKPETRP